MSPFKMPDENVSFNELKPLSREIPPAAEYPVEALGELSGSVKAAARIVQAPLALVGNAFLAGTNLATQPHADVEIDGRVHPSSLYVFTIGDSGERKDATDNVAFRPAYQHQEKLNMDHKEQLKVFESESAAYQAAKTEVIKQNKKNKISVIQDAVASLGPPPVPPIGSAKIINDFTIEGVHKCLFNGQPAIAIASTEAGQLLGGHGFSNENRIQTASGLSSLWDGKQLVRVRAGDGTGMLYNRRVCMHLMVQPVLAPLLLANTVLIGQGIVSRILIAYPQTLRGQRLYPEDQTEAAETTKSSPELTDYYNRVSTILSVPEPLKEGTRNELSPRRISLNTDAYRVWLAFYNDTERKQGKGEIFAPISGLTSKIAEHAARIAVTLALYEDLSCTNISSDTMYGAIELANYYLAEALRLHGASHVPKELQEASDLYAWLVSKGKIEVSLVEIYKTGPNWVRSAKAARVAVETLIDHGFMARMPAGIEYEGVLRSEAFKVRMGEG